MTSQTATATIQLDDGVTRTTRWDFAPGTETGDHVHQFDYIVVPVIGGVLTITMSDGQVVDSPIEAGVAYQRPAGVHHNVANRTDARISFVEIEFLDRSIGE